MRSAFFVLIAAVKFPLICVAIELDCHKEQKFVKVDQGMCYVFVSDVASTFASAACAELLINIVARHCRIDIFSESSLFEK